MNLDDAIQAIEWHRKTKHWTPDQWIELVGSEFGAWVEASANAWIGSREATDWLVREVRALQEQAARYREALERERDDLIDRGCTDEHEPPYERCVDGDELVCFNCAARFRIDAALAGSPDTGDQQ